MFRKIKLIEDSVGFGNLDLPPLPLNTDAVWVVPPAHALERVRAYGRIPEDGLLGVANAAIGVLPLWVLCDPADVGTAWTPRHGRAGDLHLRSLSRRPRLCAEAHGLMEQFLEVARS